MGQKPMTEGVYVPDLLKAIIRYAPTRLYRTPPPSALKGSHLPLHRGGKLKSTGAGPSEERPLLLERVAPKGPGVEGTIFVLSDCPEICYAPHPSWLTPSHLLPREKALDCANL